MPQYVQRLLFLLILLLPSLLLAQSGSNDKGQSLNFESSEYIYTDPAAVELSQIPTLDAVDGSTYLLGPNDILSIEIQGLFNLFAQNIAVNAQGDIVIPQLGTVNVNNLTLEEAKDAVQAKISSQYNQTELGIFSLVKAKNIIITAGGDIPEQRSMALPGMTRLYEVINHLLTTRNTPSQTAQNEDKSEVLDFSTSVPSSRRLQSQIPTSDLPNRGNSGASLYQQLSTYALRTVSIKNKMGETSKFDLLSYLHAGTTSQNPVLNSGDHIALRKLGPDAPHISISGEVAHPGIYQYLQSDDFGKLIELSGGFTSQADSSTIQLYENGKWKTTTVDNLLTRKSFSPNTHIIIGKESNSNRASSVWISGEIDQSGNYPLELGSNTVKDIIGIAGGLTEHALKNGIYIERHETDEISNYDRERYESLLLKRTSDQVIEGLEYLDLEQNVTKQRLFVNFEENADNFILQEGDHIVVPYNTQSVFVFGQVNTPGMFSFGPDKSFGDYIQLAGGKSVAANDKRVFIIKAGSKTWYKPDDTTIQPGDYIFVDRTPFIDYSNQTRLEAEDERLLWQQISVLISAVSTAVLLLNVFQN